MEISLFEFRFARILTAQERLEKFDLHLWQKPELISRYFAIGQMFEVSKFRKPLMKRTNP